MVVPASPLFTASLLRGINQDDRLMDGETPACENVIGEPLGGFSTWRGRDEVLDPQIGALSGLYTCKWPETGHDSLIIRGENALLAYQAAEYIDIGTNLEFDSDPRNPVYFTKFLYGRYLIGTTHLRDQPFFWDGHRDHPAEPLDAQSDFQVTMEWTGRLFGIGDPLNPLLAIYGDPEVLNIGNGGFLTFLDNQLATRLVGCRYYTADFALFWGDRGIWIVESTGQYPEFVRTTLIHTDCTCASNASIVRLPDNMGFAWLGTDDTAWAILGRQIRRIDLSPGGQGGDRRRSRRIQGILQSISKRSLDLVAGFYDPFRGLAVWSFPRQKCTEFDAWRDPYSLAWNPYLDAFWPISHAFKSVVEREHNGKQQLFGTDPDGKIYLVDYNHSKDKGGDSVPWNIFLDWSGDQNYVYKFNEVRLDRDLRGTDKVAIDIYNETDSTPLRGYFSLKESFKSGAKWAPATQADVDNGLADAVGELIPPLQPGGTGDIGVPPDPVITCKVKIRMRGHYLKMRLSNEDGEGGHYDGPERPMNSLSVAGTRVV